MFLPNLPRTSISGSRWCRNDREASFEIKGAMEEPARVLNGSMATRTLIEEVFAGEGGSTSSSRLLVILKLCDHPAPVVLLLPLLCRLLPLFGLHTDWNANFHVRIFKSLSVHPAPVAQEVSCNQGTCRLDERCNVSLHMQSMLCMFREPFCSETFLLWSHLQGFSLLISSRLSCRMHLLSAVSVSVSKWENYYRLFYWVRLLLSIMLNCLEIFAACCAPCDYMGRPAWLEKVGLLVLELAPDVGVIKTAPAPLPKIVMPGFQPLRLISDPLTFDWSTKHLDISNSMIHRKKSFVKKVWIGSVRCSVCLSGPFFGRHCQCESDLANLGAAP